MPQTPQKVHGTDEYKVTQSEYTADRLTPERAAELEATWDALDAIYAPLLENARNAAEAALSDLYAAAEAHNQALSSLKVLEYEYQRKRHAAKSTVGGGG